MMWLLKQAGGLIKTSVPRNLRFTRCCSTQNPVSEGPHSASNGPLSGIRIIDLTRILAGPYATMILGDLGADIIKIERPGKGDETRSWGPPFRDTQSCYFLSVNRNKRSICVNLKDQRGVKIVHDLAMQSDVLIENYIPGALDQMGLGYDALKVSSPHLIYCSISGYGATGPYSERPGFDVMAASYGGLIGVTGPENGEPCKVGVAMTDLATGLYAHGAIMAALIDRKRTGVGQRIECNLLSTQLACMVNLASNYLNGDKEAQRWGTAHESIVPYQGFATSDGYVTVAGGTDPQFEALCEALGLPELPTDPRYLTNSLRVENRGSLIATLSERFKTRSTEDWIRVFEGRPFPYAPINNIPQVFSDAQVQHSGIVQTVAHPTLGEVAQVGPAVTFSGSGNRIRSAPPTLGQHSEEVLGGILGYSLDEIGELMGKGVVA